MCNAAALSIISELNSDGARKTKDLVYPAGLLDLQADPSITPLLHRVPLSICLGHVRIVEIIVNTNDQSIYY